MCGLDIAPSSYLGVAVGGGATTPDYSVALFADLPADATVGQRVAVTGESGLSGVVCVNTALNTWEVESVTCTESAHAAVAFAATAGRWYSSGGVTVDTAAGAYVYDTTYGGVLRWLSANGCFVPAFVHAAGFSEFAKFLGDPASLAALPTAEDTDGGGTASIVSTGGKLVLTATSSAAASTFLLQQLGVTPTAAQTVYFRALMQITAQSAAGSGFSASTASVRIEDGARGWDFGRFILNNAVAVDGRWYNAATSADIAAQPVGASDLVTAETQVEIVKGNGYAMVRAGGASNRWFTVDATSCRAAAGSFVSLLAQTANSTNEKTAVLTARNIVCGVLA